MFCFPKFRLAMVAGILLAAHFAAAQIKFKLQWMPDSLAWGVFATPEAGFTPSLFTLAGSGQVTVVSPTGFAFKDFKCFSGTWSQNSFVAAPKENPGRDYISFGFLTADPPLQFQAGEETLLFSFSKKSENCPDTLYLIDSNDPFYKIPNSANTNPGNEISVMDPSDRRLYSFSGNYAPETWNCHRKKKKKIQPLKFRQGLTPGRNKEIIRP